jgi:oxaloacetate decarboxylase alpha subunit
MTSTPERRVIRIVDTSLRDGNQSLWGATGLTTGMVEAVAPLLDRAGFAAIDFTSSTHLAVGVKWHRENPWERIARMHAAAPGATLSAITTGMRFMSWDKASEVVMRLALRSMAENGLSRLQIAEPMNDIDATLRVAQWAKEEGIAQVVAAATFTESPVHTDESYRDAIEAYAAHDAIDGVYLKDPGGLLTVDRTRALIPRLRVAAGDLPLELHSHCTTGAAPEVYLVAAELGVDILHTGLGPLSNGTAQPSFERLVENLDQLGIEVDVDRTAAAEAAELLGEIARSQGLSPGAPVEYDLGPHRHQIPGGMMGTLRRQLSEIGMADKLPAVLAEATRVRAELGYPIMVTPFSQFVGSQALANVLAEERGGERWSTVSDEVIRYVLGQFGTPQGEISPDVRRTVTERSRAEELAVAAPAPDLEAFGTEQAERLERDLDDGELLLRFLLPSDQVDAMREAGAAPAWSPTSVDDAVGFVRAVEQLDSWGSLSIVREGVRIDLTRDPHRRPEEAR